jgi:tetratricopeptide (TPR) repeat protein
MRVAPVMRTVSLLLILLAVVTPALADYWYEHYDRAGKALADGDWDTAVKELLAAIERKGESGVMVRMYGMNAIPYFPYLKLGIAYYHKQQYEAALLAFETEEQLGAITGSESDLTELQRYRDLARQAIEEASAAAQKAVEEMVATCLRQARSHELGGRLDEAIAVISRGLEAAPEQTELVTMMERLQLARAEHEEQGRLLLRARQMSEQGREMLARQRFSEAARLFRQAQRLRFDPEIKRLLDQANAGIIAENAERDAEQRRALIAGSISRARSHEAAGALDEAITQLQPVLAIDPENSEAVRLYDRLVASRQQLLQLETVQQALDEAEAELAAGNLTGTLVAAYRVLALDAGNQAAVSLISKTYIELNRSRNQLGSQPRRMIPPAIIFNDLRELQADGSRVQRVSSPDFHLSGFAFGSSPIGLLLDTGDGRELTTTTTALDRGDHHITEFKLDHRLAPGTTILRVVASDDTGLSNSSRYQVVYVRPIIRSPWLYLCLAILLIAIAGVLISRRYYQRRRLLRRRYNPYVAGAPVLDQKLFFGRDQLIERILQTIHNNSLLLYGERRIGKTSLQHHIRRRLLEIDDPDYDFYPVYIDLQGTPEERFFATIGEDIFQELAPLLEDLEPSPALDRDSYSYSYRDLVRDLRRVLKRLKKISDKQVKLVLLIDEVDELNDYNPRINQRLRSLFMKSFAESLVAVVSGVEIRKQWEKEGSPWYNFFEEIEVRAISREHAEELIRRPIQGVLKLDEGLIEQIMNITECKPYLIQKLCVALVNRAHEQSRQTITRDDLEAIGRPGDS